MKLFSFCFVVFILLSQVGLASSDVEGVEVAIDMDNHSAFFHKIELIRKAEKTIDIATYIFGDDYTNSYLIRLLIDKANHDGVKVRILVDGAISSMNRGLFSFLVQEGKGNIEVAYYRPIPAQVFQDLKSWGIDDPSTVMPLLLGATDLPKDFLLRNPRLQSGFDPAGNFSLFSLFLPRLPNLARGVAASEGGLLPLVTKAIDSPDPVDTLFQLVVQENQKNGLTFTPHAWIEATKFLHHKLLIVDGKWLQGGGRNLEDSYHLRPANLSYVADSAEKRAQGKKPKYLFIDTDFYLTSENQTIASHATETFNSYWRCQKRDSEGRCAPANLNVVLEDGKFPVDPELRNLIQKRSSDYLKGLEEGNEPLQSAPRHHFAKSTARYIENRMFVPDPTSKKLLNEETSQFHQTWIEQINQSADAGETIFIHGAYFLLPSRVLAAVADAIRKPNARVIILTNSPITSDLGFVAKAARLQYKVLLQLARSVAGLHEAKKLMILEYNTNESLHSKVTLFGNRAILVSSVNPDTRCELMDTGNGLLIQPPSVETAPAANQAWKQEMAKFRKEIFDYGTDRSPLFDVPSVAAGKKVVRITLEAVEAQLQAAAESITEVNRKTAHETFVAKLIDWTETVTLGKSGDVSGAKEKTERDRAQAAVMLDTLFLQL